MQPQATNILTREILPAALDLTRRANTAATQKAAAVINTAAQICKAPKRSGVFIRHDVLKRNELNKASILKKNTCLKDLFSTKKDLFYAGIFLYMEFYVTSEQRI